MGATGGSIESVSFAGREFAVAGDADANLDLGGFSNAQEANGNATTRLIKTRKVWVVDGLSLTIDDDNGDLEFLQDTADLKDNQVCTFTLVSGVTYQGEGQVTGDLQKSTQSTTATVSFSGPGKLTKQ